MIYFYQCSSCQHIFTSDSGNLELCSECGQQTVGWKRCATGTMPKPREEGLPVPQIISRKRTRPNGFYDMQHRSFKPGVKDPEAYERDQESDWADANKRAKDIKRERGSSRSGEEHLIHKGRIPLGQFLARQAEVNHDTDQLFDTDYWKHQGRIFDSAKDE